MIDFYFETNMSCFKYIRNKNIFVTVVTKRIIFVTITIRRDVSGFWEALMSTNGTRVLYLLLHVSDSCTCKVQ